MKLTRPALVSAAVGLAIALPLGAGAAASSSGVQPTTATITGGVVDTGSHALAGICIAVRDSAGNFDGQDMTAADGTYTVSNLLPGTYLLTYQDCNRSSGPNVEPQYYDNTQVYSSHQAVTLVAGQTKSLDTQTMQPGAQASLHLVDSHGAAVPNVEVAMETQNTPVFLPSFDSLARSDANGNLTFVGLLPLPYTLQYESCPHIFCASIGYYHSQLPTGTPTVVHPVVGSPLALSDVLDVPVVASSTTTVTAAPATSTIGQTVTLTATVSVSDGSTPFGYVVFNDGTANVAATSFGSLGPSGVVSATTTALPVGSSTVIATFVPSGFVTQSSGGVAVTVNAAPAGGGGSSGSGGSSGGGGGGSSPVSGNVPAGGTLGSDPVGTTPDAANPLVVGITSPVAGPITIDKTPPNTPLKGYTVLGVGATITAPTATAANPLNLSFQIFVGDLPAGSYASDLTVFRNGVAIGACTGAGATPDPCVASSNSSGGVVTINVRSSHASTWDVEAATVGRIAGSTRFATAVAASQDSFPTGHAGAVVLARADDYPDALVGAPLAAVKNAPLLLTQGATLPAVTAAEIARVLPAGGTVYLLGGTVAIPASVASQLTTMGYHPVRYAGTDRYSTAVAVADALGDPSTVLLATGSNFPDALSAGPAAAHLHGAVLLTSGATLPAATSAYLSSKSHTVYTIGGPAAAADPQATAISGADRFATAAAVATKFFPAPTTIGIATGATFPDALAGGAQLALVGAPLLLSTTTAMPGVTTTYLGAVHSGMKDAHVFGGSAALADGVVSQLRSAVGG